MQTFSEEEGMDTVTDILRRIPDPGLNNVFDHYRMFDKYMRQPPALTSGVRISRKPISRVWTLRKVK
jgi:hypothetical protein